MLAGPDRAPDRLGHRVLPGPVAPPDAFHRGGQQAGDGRRRVPIGGRGVRGRGIMRGPGGVAKGHVWNATAPPGRPGCTARRAARAASGTRRFCPPSGGHTPALRCPNARSHPPAPTAILGTGLPGERRPPPGRRPRVSSGCPRPAQPTTVGTRPGRRAPRGSRGRAGPGTMNFMTEPHPPAAAFRSARDLLLRHRDDYAAARREFSWPALDEFNWALDWFDVIAAEHPDQAALRIVADGDAAAQLSYGELAARSNQVANWLSELGARRGDRLLLMLGNIAPLWEVILAAMKLGVVIIPASTLLGTADLADRITRGDVRHVVAEAGLAARFDGLGGRWTAIAVGPGPDSGATPDGWLPYADAADESRAYTPDGITRATDPLLLYFTSGTTAQPKLVEHTHASYPAGHLSTMYWIGLQPGDVHLNISSPGWAKHAWSNVFAPWNAEAT